VVGPSRTLKHTQSLGLRGAHWGFSVRVKKNPTHVRGKSKVKSERGEQGSGREKKPTGGLLKQQWGLRIPGRVRNMDMWGCNPYCGKNNEGGRTHAMINPG